MAMDSKPRRACDNRNSLRSFTRGPTPPEGFILLNKIAHFDHERIPGRVVHARGSAAHGYFGLTDALAKYTTARAFTTVGARTRISSVTSIAAAKTRQWQRAASMKAGA